MHSSPHRAPPPPPAFSFPSPAPELAARVGSEAHSERTQLSTSARTKQSVPTDAASSPSDAQDPELASCSSMRKRVMRIAVSLKRVLNRVKGEGRV